jgi:putative nucleotidyltransferase with HDIG domain
MFGWLSRLFGARTDPPRTRAGTRAQGGAQRRSAASGAKGETYLATLAQELQAVPMLSPEEEQQTSDLVERVTRYVGTHAIDPPVVPALATRMLDLLRQAEVDVQELTRLIERDQATAAKVLSIANSAVYRGRSEIGTVRDAVVFLGTEQVAQIAIVLATRAMFESPKERALGGTERWSRLFNHAMTTAFCSCHLVTQRSKRHSEAAFLGGLFHDVGKTVALRAVHEMLKNEGGKAASDTVVDAALQLIHAEPTSVLYESWKLPESLIRIVRNHHRLSAEAPRELHFVRLVSALDTLRAGADVEKHEALQEVGESAAALKMADAELRAAHTSTKEFAERVQQMFG